MKMPVSTPALQLRTATTGVMPTSGTHESWKSGGTCCNRAVSASVIDGLGPLVGGKLIDGTVEGVAVAGAVVAGAVVSGASVSVGLAAASLGVAVASAGVGVASAGVLLGFGVGLAWAAPVGVADG